MVDPDKADKLDKKLKENQETRISWFRRKLDEEIGRRSDPRKPRSQLFPRGKISDQKIPPHQAEGFLFCPLFVV